MNVFKEMVLSIYSYESYSQFLKNKKGKVFGFGVLLMLIYFACTLLLRSMLPPDSIFELEDIIRENLPEFSLEDGTFWMEEAIEQDTGNGYIYIDTDTLYPIQDADEIKASFRGYSNVIIMDYEKIIVKNDGSWQALQFSDLDMDFDKEDVMAFVPWLYVAYAIFMVIAWIFMTAFFFFGVLFVALIGMIIASCMNYQITFGQLYLIGIYSRTLPLLIKAVVSYLPFSIPFFWILNFGLSAFIIAMAIKKMKEQRPEMPMSAPFSGDYM